VFTFGVICICYLYIDHLMGVKYSKYQCTNPTAQCAQFTPIAYTKYQADTKRMTPQQINAYMCQSKPGTVQQCCDPFDQGANLPVNDGTLVKTEVDAQGQPTKFLVCTCAAKDIKCQQDYCANFKVPTQYEKCRMRATDPKYQITDKSNLHIYSIVPANAYANCYQTCKTGS
jgi:hypothetical protein